MTTKKVTTKGGTRGKAEGSDKVTAERLRAFLASPDVKERVKGEVKKLVNQLYAAGQWDTLPATSEYFGLLFQQTFINDHLAGGTAQPDEREIYDRLAAAIDRHEPQDERTVRGLLARAYPTDADRERATHAALLTGSIIDHVSTLASELDVTIFHPDVLPHALPVIMRAARAVKGRSRHAQWLRSFLRALEEAAGE